MEQLSIWNIQEQQQPQKLEKYTVMFRNEEVPISYMQIVTKAERRAQ